MKEPGGAGALAPPDNACFVLCLPPVTHAGRHQNRRPGEGAPGCTGWQGAGSVSGDFSLGAPACPHLRAQPITKDPEHRRGVCPVCEPRKVLLQRITPGIGSAGKMILLLQNPPLFRACRETLSLRGAGAQAGPPPAQTPPSPDAGGRGRGAGPASWLPSRLLAWLSGAHAGGEALRHSQGSPQTTTLGAWQRRHQALAEAGGTR